MNTLKTNIHLASALSVSTLSMRSTAKKVIQMITDCATAKVVIDFEGINFASRSFMDELNSRIDLLEDITVQKVNMSDDVNAMNSFERSKKRKKREKNTLDTEMNYLSF